MHHSCRQKKIVWVVVVGQIAFRQMNLVLSEMVAGLAAVEERRHRVTRLIASSPVAIERLV